jgi:hypothetical protein
MDFREAVKSGNDDRVMELLQDDSVNPAADDNYAIRRASELGHSATVVKCLLEDARVDPAADDNSAIRLALQNSHLSAGTRHDSIKIGVVW